MKSLLAILFTLFSFSCSAQKENSIQNSSWVGIAPVPKPTEVKFEFLTDTVNMYVHDQIIESMNFSIQNDTMYLRKLYGGSPCDPEQLMVWQYAMEGNKLTLTVLSDDCQARSRPGEPVIYRRYAPTLKIE